MKLPKLRGKYKLNYNLSHLSWFKVGGMAKIFFRPADEIDLKTFLTWNSQKQQGEKLEIFPLGAGSNILIRDGGIDGCCLKLGNAFANIVENTNEIIAGAAVLNYNFAKYCQENSIGGYEFLLGIPGTLGGGIIMNAGCYGSEFKDMVTKIEAIDFKGNNHLFSNAEIGFIYRGNSLPKDLIITKLFLRKIYKEKSQIIARHNEITAQRIATQPIYEKTCGSIFANIHGQKVWELIDGCGLRGYKIGGAQISNKHCNFMINCGTSTAEDLEQLGNFVAKSVLDKYGISLKWEIKIVGVKT